MSINERIMKWIENKRNQFAEEERSFNFITITSLFFSTAYRFALSRWHLRKVDSLGSLTTTNGCPKIINNGNIIIGDDCRILVKCK